MYISRLCLQNYRCYDNFEIDFNKELTVIVAENGKGKTARSVIRTYARPRIQQAGLWSMYCG